MLIKSTPWTAARACRNILILFVGKGQRPHVYEGRARARARAKYVNIVTFQKHFISKKFFNFFISKNLDILKIQPSLVIFQKWSILPNGRGGVQFNFPRRSPKPPKIPNFSVFINKSLIKTAKSRVSWSAEKRPRIGPPGFGHPLAQNCDFNHFPCSSNLHPELPRARVEIF